MSGGLPGRVGEEKKRRPQRKKMEKLRPPPRRGCLQEALKIRRGLAKKAPRAFNQAVATTLLNLSIFYLQAMPDKDKSVAYAQEAREILKSLIKQAPHLQYHLDVAERLLKRNKAKPTS